MKKLALLSLFGFILAGCSSEPKYVQPTEKGTKAGVGAKDAGGGRSGAAPIAKD